MAINAKTREIVTRMLHSHIGSCEESIHYTSNFLAREKGRVDQDYYHRRENSLIETTGRLNDLRSALKDVQLNA